MRILFVHKENQNNDFIQQFPLFRVGRRALTACKQGITDPGSMLECRVLRQQHHMYMSWYSRERKRRNKGLKGLERHEAE